MIKTIRAILIGKSYRFIWLGIGLSIFFLIIDIMFDAYFFPEEGILKLLLAPTWYEIYMRSSVIVLVLAFSAYAQVITERLQINQSKLEQELVERKQAEEKLHEASLYTRNLIEVSLDPLVTISKDGKITDVNIATELATGVSRERLIGSDFSEYFTEPEKARKGYEQVFEKGFVKDYPLAIRHVSGSITDVLYNASMYKNADGDVTGVFAAARDVTERKRVEDIARAERQRFYDVLEMLPAYIILLTPDYHVFFSNRFFRERFAESNGRRCFEFLFERNEPCENCETYKVPKTLTPHEWEWTGPDTRNYHIFDSPFTDTDGSVLIIEMGIDITERKRAEEEIKKQLEELQRWHNATLGRETRILDLKREVNGLLGATGQTPRYPSVVTNGQTSEAPKNGGTSEV